MERWQLPSGNNGLNISGIEPATGHLTLWSVGARVIGRTGYWNVLGDDVLGQVQGSSQLIRKITKSSEGTSFKAIWHTLKNGRFVETNVGYTATRSKSGVAERDSNEAADFGEPKLIARIEYMKVPEGCIGWLRRGRPSCTVRHWTLNHDESIEEDPAPLMGRPFPNSRLGLVRSLAIELPAAAQQSY